MYLTFRGRRRLEEQGEVMNAAERYVIVAIIISEEQTQADVQLWRTAMLICKPEEREMSLFLCAGHERHTFQLCRQATCRPAASRRDV